MVNDQTLSKALRKHNEINDRFTFDDLFRMSLHTGFSHEETKNIILNNCSLSAIVFQERIENKSYLKMSDEISSDLIELYGDMRNKKLLHDIQEAIEGLEK